MLRALVLITGLSLAAVTAHVAAPIVTAWQIREAVRTGDAGTLKAKVDWLSVRHTLKTSLGESRAAIGEITDAAGAPRPSLWQRMKAAALPYVSDPLIDRYVTPEGVPQLYAWRQSMRRRAETARAAAGGGPRASLAKPLAENWFTGTWLAGSGVERAVAAAQRVERLTFQGPGRLVVEIADRQRSNRRWRAVMEMRGLGWKLTEMHAVPVPLGGFRPPAWRAAERRS